MLHDSEREMPGWDRLSSWLDLNSIHLSDAPSTSCLPLSLPLLLFLPSRRRRRRREREEERVLWFTKFGVWYIPCGVLSKFPVITASPPRSKPWVARRKTLIRGPVDFESSIFGRFVRLLSLSLSQVAIVHFASYLFYLSPENDSPCQFSLARIDCGDSDVWLVGFWSIRSYAISMYIRM